MKVIDPDKIIEIYEKLSREDYDLLISDKDEQILLNRKEAVGTFTLFLEEEYKNLDHYPKTLNGFKQFLGDEFKKYCQEEEKGNL